MKKIFLLLTFTFVLMYSSELLSQATTDRRAIPTSTLSTKERYKNDYELVDESLLGVDSLVLNTINLSRIDFNRHKTEDVIYLDKRINLEILIYSESKISQRK